MDAELRELERLFEAAQQAKPSARLSERNVVELVLKLQELQLLDSDLLHTTSGKEYLTQGRLREEMETEIKRLGRVSLVDMSSAVGVDYFHCERQAEQLKQNNPSITLEQGEFFTTSYWDTLAEDVNETLKQASHVSLGELATRFNVGVELLTGILSSRIGTLIRAKLEGGQLYTPAYISRVKSMVRGAIRALTVPTNLSSVWSLLQSQLRTSDEIGVTGEIGLFTTCLSELVSEGSVSGSVRGGGSTWTPAVFAQSQRESVANFYSQNSYITYDALKKLSIPSPKQYLQTRFPKGIALETVFVHESFISLLDSAAEEAITGGGWFDAVDVVPSTFGSPDAAKLLHLCPSVEKALKEATVTSVAETCIVGANFMKELLEKFQNILRETHEKSLSIVGNGAKSEPEPEKSKKPEKKQLSEEEDEVKPSKNKRKGGRGKASKVAASKDSSSKASSKVSHSEENEVPSEEKLVEKILEWHPDLEAAGTEDGYSGVLAKSLAAQLRPTLLAYMVSLKRAYLGAKVEERRKRAEALRMKINEDYANLQLFIKSLDLFEDDKALEAMLEKHLLRTSASGIADNFLEAQFLEHIAEKSENNEPLPSKPFTPAARLSLAKGLPGSLASDAVELVEALEGKSIGGFDSAMEMAAKESGIRVRKLDRKAERALFHSYRKSLVEQVELEENPITLLPKVVALLYAQIHGRALQAPGRAMSSAVTRLKKHLGEEAYRTLEIYHSATVSYLARNDETQMEILQQKLTDLKALTRATGGEDKVV